MKEIYLNKVDQRITAIIKKEKSSFDGKNRLQHDWKVYKLLMRGKYKPQAYINPLGE